jgi:hypothetical protein
MYAEAFWCSLPMVFPRLLIAFFCTVCWSSWAVGKAGTKVVRDHGCTIARLHRLIRSTGEECGGAIIGGVDPDAKATAIAWALRPTAQLQANPLGVGLWTPWRQ